MQLKKPSEMKPRAGPFCKAMLKNRNADILIRIKRIAPLTNNSSMKNEMRTEESNATLSTLLWVFVRNLEIEFVSTLFTTTSRFISHFISIVSTYKYMYIIFIDNILQSVFLHYYQEFCTFPFLYSKLLC